MEGGINEPSELLGLSFKLISVLVTQKYVKMPLAAHLKCVNFAKCKLYINRGIIKFLLLEFLFIIIDDREIRL